MHPLAYMLYSGQHSGQQIVFSADLRIYGLNVPILQVFKQNSLC